MTDEGTTGAGLLYGPQRLPLPTEEEPRRDPPPPRVSSAPWQPTRPHTGHGTGKATP